MQHDDNVTLPLMVRVRAAWTFSFISSYSSSSRQLYLVYHSFIVAYCVLSTSVAPQVAAQRDDDGQSAYAGKNCASST
jgi:hypothetical protein